MYWTLGSILSSLPQPFLWVHAKQDPQQVEKNKIRNETIRHGENIKLKSEPKLITPRLYL